MMLILLNEITLLSYMILSASDILLKFSSNIEGEIL